MNVSTPAQTVLLVSWTCSSFLVSCVRHILLVFIFLQSFTVLIFSVTTYFLLYIWIRLTVLSFCASLCFRLDSCVFRVVVLGRTWPSNSVYMLYLHILLSPHVLHHFLLCWDENLQMFCKVSATLGDLDVNKCSQHLRVKHLAGSVAGCVWALWWFDIRWCKWTETLTVFRGISWKHNTAFWYLILLFFFGNLVLTCLWIIFVWYCFVLSAHETNSRVWSKTCIYSLVWAENADL